MKTDSRPLMRDLDHLPFPSRDLIDTEQYRQAWKSAHGYFSLNIVGQPRLSVSVQLVCEADLWRLIFHALAGDGRRRNAPAEIRLWGRASLVCRRYFWPCARSGFANWPPKSKSSTQPFRSRCRLAVDLMTPDTVSALRRAGCAEVWMGVESGSQKILDAMDKGTRVDQIAKARENLRQ